MVMSATPVGWSTTRRIPVTSIPSRRRSSSSVSPSPSEPTAPTIAVSAPPARAAPTAWFAPLPPPLRWIVSASRVSPGLGSRVVRTATSMFTEPTTTTRPLTGRPVPEPVRWTRAPRGGVRPGRCAGESWAPPSVRAAGGPPRGHAVRAPRDTLVSDGLNTRANWVSSIPTTASCCGTRRRALWAARMTPKASRSFAAITASGRRRGSSAPRVAHASSPAPTVKSSTSTTGPVEPVAAQACWYPSLRARPGAVSAGPLTKAMRRRPVSSRWAWAMTTPRARVGPYRVQGRALPDVTHDHHGDRCVDEGVDQLGGATERADDEAVRVAAGEAADQGDEVGEVVPGRGDEEPGARTGHALLDPAHHLRVDRVADVVDGERHLHRRAQLERPARGVGDVAELGDRRPHAVLGVRPGRLAVEDPRDRRDGDAGPVGDLHDRRSPAHRSPDLPHGVGDGQGPVGQRIEGQVAGVRDRRHQATLAAGPSTVVRCRRHRSGHP